MGLSITAKIKIYLDCELFHEVEDELPPNDIILHSVCGEKEDGNYTSSEEEYTRSYSALHDWIRGPAVNLEHGEPSRNDRTKLNEVHNNERESVLNQLLNHEDNEGYYLPLKFDENKKVVWINGTSFGSLPYLYDELLWLKALPKFEGSALENQVFDTFFKVVEEAHKNNWILEFG